MLWHAQIIRELTSGLRLVARETDGTRDRMNDLPRVQHGSRSRRGKESDRADPRRGRPSLANQGERLTQTAMMPSFTKKYTTNAAMETQKRGFTSLAFPDVTFKMP